MWTSAKIAAPFIIFGVSTVSGILPCITLKHLAGKFGASSILKRAIGILNCFSGGIFFATSILDLLPESRESMEYVFSQRGIDTDFPLPECIMGVGFLFILFIENIAHLCHSKWTSNTTVTSVGKPRYTFLRKFFAKFTKTHETSSTSDENNSSSVGFDNINYENNDSAVIPIDTFQLPRNEKDSVADNESSRTESIELSTTQITEYGEDGNVQDISDTEKGVTGHDSEHVVTGTNNQRTPLRNMVLLIALSLHMIFDGLAVGVLEKQSEIWQLLLALGIHKTLVFVTIGIQVHQIFNSVTKTIVSVVLFSFISPGGVVVGGVISASENGIGQKIVSAVLLSFAAGNFLFITFFEILQPELGGNDHDILKVFFAVLGYTMFALMKFFVHEGN